MRDLTKRQVESEESNRAENNKPAGTHTLTKLRKNNKNKKTKQLEMGLEDQDHGTIKQVTQHTETITGRVAADVRTACDQETEQEKAQQVTNKPNKTNEINITEIQTRPPTPEQIKEGRMTCECNDCSNGMETDCDVKNRAVDTIKTLLKPCTEWPPIVGKIQLAFGQENTHKNTKGYLARVQLCKCRIKLAQAPEEDNEVTVLNDANSFMYGI